ncbi:MAG TPA: hypothetical protein VFB10_08415 [Candidatus Dormibacteraeota bacterium]|nr:hypothetical protein [Candidatus Dormibacteraeota bacterium]
MRKSLPLVLVFLFTPILANAQHAAGPAMAQATGAMRPVMIVPAAHIAPVTGVAPAHPNSRPVTGFHAVPSHRSPMRPVSSPKPPVKPQMASSNPRFVGAPVAENDLGVPGLGFDYVHYFATHPNAGRRHFQGGVVPFVGGSIYVPFPVYVDGGAPAESAAEGGPAEAEQPVSAEEAAAGPADVAVRPYASSRAPVEPDSEYVFVRRDGTVFFAVAFTFDSTDLRYITGDGFRKSAPLASLDLVATQQFNEQRGLTPRLPS